MGQVDPVEEGVPGAGKVGNISFWNKKTKFVQIYERWSKFLVSKILKYSQKLLFQLILFTKKW